MPASSEPSDTILVPEDMKQTTCVQTTKGWTLILSQPALGVAAPMPGN